MKLIHFAFVLYIIPLISGLAKPDLQVQPGCDGVDRPRLEGHVFKLVRDHGRGSAHSQVEARSGGVDRRTF